MDDLAHPQDAGADDVADDLSNPAVIEAENTDAQNLYPEDHPEDEPQEGEPDDDLDEDDADGEPEEDIAAPVGLKAEEKDQFAQLPREAQRVMSDILQRRDRDAQTGVQNALSKAQEAERSAADRIAQTQRAFAGQFNQLVSAFAPQEPPIELARDNPAEYQYQKALWEQDDRAFQSFVQQVQALSDQADNHDEARDREQMADQLRQLMTIPEVANEETRVQFISDIQNVGSEMGYTPEALASVDAQDVFALKKALSWKSDAEKWRAHQKKRNERPRAATGRFSAAPAGARAAGQSAQIDTLKAMYPND